MKKEGARVGRRDGEKEEDQKGRSGEAKHKMTFVIRKGIAGDASRLAGLLGGYLRETYHGEWGGTVDLLKTHLASGAIEILVAENLGCEIIGLLAWSSCYDLHWCMKGGMIVDLYVPPSHRGRGIAARLATDLAKEIEARGGTFLKGGPVDNPGVLRLYRRVAIQYGGDGDFTISGRAFRHFASLSGKNLREIVRDLPDPAWNMEP